jgi:hypothetical protein
LNLGDDLRGTVKVCVFGHFEQVPGGN